MAKKTKKIEVQEEVVIETPVKKIDNRKLELTQELARLRKLHQDQVELGINPDAKLEVLITNLDNEIKSL